MIRDLLAVAVGVIIIVHATVIMIRGEVSFAVLYFFNDRATRKDDPNAFWTITIMWLALGAFLTIAGIHELIDRRAGMNMNLPPAVRNIEKQWRANNPSHHTAGSRATAKPPAAGER